MTDPNTIPLRGARMRHRLTGLRCTVRRVMVEVDVDGLVTDEHAPHAYLAENLMPLDYDSEMGALYDQLADLAGQLPDKQAEHDEATAKLRNLQRQQADEMERYARLTHLDPVQWREAVARAESLLAKHRKTWGVFNNKDEEVMNRLAQEDAENIAARWNEYAAERPDDKRRWKAAPQRTTGMYGVWMSTLSRWTGSGGIEGTAATGWCGTLDEARAEVVKWRKVEIKIGGANAYEVRPYPDPALDEREVLTKADELLAGSSTPPALSGTRRSP